jgi:XTP/dITP diphosphohydrolase
VKKLLIASNNPHKLKEFAAMLAPLGIEALPQGKLFEGEAEEPHQTFLENALAKARFAARCTGMAALADDSGLVVPALGGAPGVHSAYYGGKEGDRDARDARNNAKLVEAMREVADRRAFYYGVLVYLRGPADPTPIVTEGFWHGEIVLQGRGSGGFGYNPHFLTVRGLTAAELSDDEKNRLSHRGQALAAMARRLARPGSDPLSPNP